jgi:hypothetical protein
MIMVYIYLTDFEDCCYCYAFYLTFEEEEEEGEDVR